MPVTKKQHFVPASYLRGFMNDGSQPVVLVHEKQSREVWGSDPSAIGYEKYTYQVEYPDGTIDKDSIEKHLAKLDGNGIPLIRKVVSGEIPTDDERFDLSFFIAMMIFRNPITFQNVENLQELLYRRILDKQSDDPEWLSHIIALSGLPATMTFNNQDPMTTLKTIIKEGHFDLQFLRGHAMWTFSLAIDFAKVIAQMRWNMLRIRDDAYFVCSDNPVFFGTFETDTGMIHYGGIGRPEATLLFPLDSKTALYADWRGGPRYSDLHPNSELIRFVNKRTIAIARRFVYSPTRSLSLSRLIHMLRNSSVQLDADNPHVSLEPLLHKHIAKFKAKSSGG